MLLRSRVQLRLSKNSRQSQGVARDYTRGLLLLLGVLLAVVTAEWLFNAPKTLMPLPPPALVAALSTLPTSSVETPTAQTGAAGAPDAVATTIANYRMLTDAMNMEYKVRSKTYIDSRMKLLDAGPVKIIVPLVTLLLGYLFGIQSNTSNPPNNES